MPIPVARQQACVMQAIGEVVQKCLALPCLHLLEVWLGKVRSHTQNMSRVCDQLSDHIGCMLLHAHRSARCLRSQS